MDALKETIAEAFNRRLDAFLDQARTLTEGLTEEEFWSRPYAYGNSAGHLLLHITGNLNYYIGTEIAHTGYVRNRDLEFSDATKRPKTEVLRDLAAAVVMVKETVLAQSTEDWSAPYSGKGTDEVNRFGMLLRCIHHFHHHLGQLIYLAKEHAIRRGGR